MKYTIQSVKCSCKDVCVLWNTGGEIQEGFLEE